MNQTPMDRNKDVITWRLKNTSETYSINDASTVKNHSVNNPTASQSPVVRLLDSVKWLDPRKQLKSGSKRASTLTLVTSMVGGGVLALPYGMYNSGFFFTSLYFVIIGSIAIWTVYGVILVGQKTNSKTYYDIAKVLFSGRVAILIEIVMVLILVLASVAYLTMVKNVLPRALQVILNTDEGNTWTSANFLLPLVAVFVISPLSLMRKVAALRYASLCGFSFVLYLIVVVALKFFDYCDKYGSGCLTSNPTVPSVWTQMNFYGIGWTGHMYTIPLIIGSYTAHPTVLPIYIELQKKSPKDMWVVILVGHSLTALVFFGLSAFGYFTFLSDTKPNFLLNDYHHNFLVIFGAVGFCLVCILAIPLFTQANRRSITTLYFEHFGKETRLKKPLLFNHQKLSFSCENEEGKPNLISSPGMVVTPALACAAELPQPIKSPKNLAVFERKLPMWANLIITFGFLAIEVSVSLYMSNIGVVLAFIGMSCYPLGCYLFPTLALWKLHAQYPKDEDINCKLLFIVTTSTVIVCILGLIGLLVEFQVIS